MRLSFAVHPYAVYCDDRPGAFFSNYQCAKDTALYRKQEDAKMEGPFKKTFTIRHSETGLAFETV